MPIGAMLSLVAAGPRLAAVVAEAVSDAAADGHITPDEGEAIGRRLSSLSGDLLEVRIKGRDVVDLDAQADMLGALGRIVARIVNAKA